MLENIHPHPKDQLWRTICGMHASADFIRKQIDDLQAQQDAVQIPLMALNRDLDVLLREIVKLTAQHDAMPEAVKPNRRKHSDPCLEAWVAAAEESNRSK
jgi:hypothetical protein